MKTIAILGYPGAGKSWAVYELLKSLEVYFYEDIELTRGRVGLVDYHCLGPLAIVGIYDGTTFQGTDRLSMAVAPDFPKFFEAMTEQKKELIIAEGDRINNMTFMKTALLHGSLERIKCDPGSYQKLLEQRAQRNHTFSNQFLHTVASKVDKHNFDKIMTSSELAEYLEKTTRYVAAAR